MNHISLIVMSLMVLLTDAELAASDRQPVRASYFPNT
jgi:hypothetical protein